MPDVAVAVIPELSDGALEMRKAWNLCVCSLLCVARGIYSLAWLDVCPHAHEFTCMWRPKAGAGCLSCIVFLLSLFIEVSSLTAPEIR